MSLDTVLDDFEAGRISREDVKRELVCRTFVEAGCAKIDIHREQRTGGPEVVYCESKSPDQVAAIFTRLVEHNGKALGTRACEEHFHAVRDRLECRYDPVSRLLIAETVPTERVGKVVVITAGTSDQGVAEEAIGTAEFLGSRVERYYDCGVAGIHRLFSVVDELTDASAIIVVAGMEGALPSVVGGMVTPPIIAVPTSVGYGANFQGLAALLTMMNSCAPGIGVVNIDNGFGAGYLAHKINSRLF